MLTEAMRRGEGLEGCTFVACPTTNLALRR